MSGSPKSTGKRVSTLKLPRATSAQRTVRANSQRSVHVAASVASCGSHCSGNCTTPSPHVTQCTSARKLILNGTPSPLSSGSRDGRVYSNASGAPTSEHHVSRVASAPSVHVPSVVQHSRTLRSSGSAFSRCASRKHCSYASTHTASASVVPPLRTLTNCEPQRCASARSVTQTRLSLVGGSSVTSVPVALGGKSLSAPTSTTCTAPQQVRRSSAPLSSVRTSGTLSNAHVSHASPVPSLSASACAAFGTLTQLSAASHTPSLSTSRCDALGTLGAQSHTSDTPSLSASSASAPLASNASASAAHSSASTPLGATRVLGCCDSHTSRASTRHSVLLRPLVVVPRTQHGTGSLAAPGA